MTKEAADVLQQFYLQLRKHSNADGSPITARQLESLVRLVESRARMELREEISKQDAKVYYLRICILQTSRVYMFTCSQACWWYDGRHAPTYIVDFKLHDSCRCGFPAGCGGDYERVIV